MNNKVLIIDSSLERLRETVQTLRNSGYTTSGETTLPLDKPVNTHIIILCLTTIIGVELFLEKLSAWNIPVAIWCDRLPANDRVRALLIGTLFNKNHGLVVDVFGPVPTMPADAIRIFQEALHAITPIETTG
jgi:hypothetical protein